MKLEYMSANKRFKLTFEGDEKQLFQQVGQFQEVFENQNTCGNKSCGSDNVTFNVREVEGNKYYEKRCQDCGMKFQYGQHKQGGTLFPNNSKGWHRWTPDAVGDDAEENTGVNDKPRKVAGVKK